MGLKITASKRREEKKKKVFVDGLPYVWMEGYKGTDNDMCCRGYQYSLNEEFTHQGKVELCGSGFHFCKHLSEVIEHYYSFDGNNRYFKVKALVPLSDSKNDWDKYSAKKIVFVEEVEYKQLERYIKEECPLVKSEEDWIKCREIGYSEFCKEIFRAEMSKYGYSETFVDVLFDEKDEYELNGVIQKAKAFYEEKISKDLAVYMLMKY